MNKIEKAEKKKVEYKATYRSFTETDAETGAITEATFKTDVSIAAQVIRQDKYTIVIFDDGSKGVSQCMEGDIFSRKKGLKIAYNRAMIEHLKKETKRLAYE